jgi:pimeloyl-ACP methyl ester carboxylesterase
MAMPETPRHIDLELTGGESVEVLGGRVVYELLGSPQGQLVVLTPGGRFSKDVPGLRPLAEKLVEGGLRVLLWDRPNTGASDVQFWGDTESHMKAEVLAALLRELDLAPAVLAGGSAGARDSIITTINHPDVVSKLFLWNITGGSYGLLLLGSLYVMPSIVACKLGGIEGVLDMPEWQARIEANPRNRDRMLGLGTEGFLKVMMRWLDAYVPNVGQTIPGVRDAEFEAITVPATIIRGGENDDDHPKLTSHEVHCLIRGSRLIDPPWPEDAWERAVAASARGEGHIFDPWVQAAPAILEFCSA